MNDDTNDSYTYFIKTFTMLYDECFPFIKQTNVKCKPNKPWISNGLLLIIIIIKRSYIAHNT